MVGLLTVKIVQHCTLRLRLEVGTFAIANNTDNSVSDRPRWGIGLGFQVKLVSDIC